MRVLGIDPGMDGGIAVLTSEGELISVAAVEIPTSGEKAKRRVDVSAIVALLKPQLPIRHAYIERAQAMPKQGSSSGFNYGRAVGALEAVVETLGIPTDFVEPSAWKRFHGLLQCGKEDSRQRALKLFPGSPDFRLKKHHGPAEAALIGWYGLKFDMRNMPTGRNAA